MSEQSIIQGIKYNSAKPVVASKPEKIDHRPMNQYGVRYSLCSHTVNGTRCHSPGTISNGRSKGRRWFCSKHFREHC